MNRACPLIVGAAGQVGSALFEVLGPTAVRATRTATKAGWVELDLSTLANQPENAQSLVARLNPSAIYCVGASTDVDGCENDVKRTMNTNCYGPASLAYAARGIPFVYFSTEYIFDGRSGPYDEEHCPAPISVYGRSKWEGEQAILAAHPNALVIRTTVVYGPEPQGKNFIYSLHRLLRDGKVMRVPGDQISTPTYNVDLATATVELVRQRSYGIFHVCGPELLSRYDFAVSAAEVLGLNVSLITKVRTAELKQVAQRPLHAGLSTERLRNVLGSDVMRSNREALTDWKRLGGPE